MFGARKERIAKTAAAAVVVLCLAAAAPASAQDEEPNAIVNGLAWAAGVDLPAAVTPNVEVAPVYSFSKVNNGESHGISAGLWPGDILHAFADVYGYGDPARSMMGIAESLWPDRPHDESATSDFGAKCPFFGLLVPHGVPKDITDFLTGGCFSFWDNTRAYYPYRAASGSSTSRQFATSGTADGTDVALPNDIHISDVHSTSSTGVSAGKTISESTLVYKDVHIGDLSISQIRSVARAESNGKAGGVKASRSLEVIGASVGGTPVTIGEEGVQALDDTQNSDQFKQIQAQLAAQGFDVRLVQGADTTGTDEAQALSGGLVVHMVRAGATPEQVDPACSQLDQAYPDPFATAGPFDFGANPLYKDVFPENQLPERLGIDQALPPPFLCPLQELVRTADVAVVLGTTVAQARYVPLPAVTIYEPPSIPEQVIHRTITIPGSGGGSTIVIGPRSLPETPKTTRPVGDPLSGVAAKVKLLYGLLAGMIAILLVGRNTFRNLVRT